MYLPSYQAVLLDLTQGGPADQCCMYVWLDGWLELLDLFSGDVSFNIHYMGGTITSMQVRDMPQRAHVEDNM